MIAPWNFPAAMIARKVAPAIAVGCTVVIKPPSLTPISALALAKLAHQAGIPAGVVNIVPTDKTNSSAVGRAICESPDVAALSFTGSTNVGKLLLKQCAGTVKKEIVEIAQIQSESWDMLLVFILSLFLTKLKVLNGIGWFGTIRCFPNS